MAYCWGRFPDGVPVKNHLLIGCLMAVACLHAQAQIASCPQRLRVMEQRGELADAQLFIGLPEKKRELKRPAKQQQWVLAKLHKRAAASKEGLFLQCRYGGMKASVTIPVPPVAAACVIENKTGKTTIRCE
jgi:hypothetical protein